MSAGKFDLASYNRHDRDRDRGHDGYRHGGYDNGGYRRGGYRGRGHDHGGYGRNRRY
jgi:hypothetical protein